LNLLLDTHVLIWALENNPRLSESARAAIVDGENLVFASAVSVWEISVKQAMGKLHVPDNLIKEIQIHRFTPLEINPQHAHLAGRLPAIHKDPFDRMLIAQAILEKLTIVTRDQIINQYDVTVLRA
jgi:PIN domain nuclease of toxin-antitoxin system